jgi:hypothetical protein
MRDELIKKELRKQGLRKASLNEAGWYVYLWDEEMDESIKVWATEQR